MKFTGIAIEAASAVLPGEMRFSELRAGKSAIVALDGEWSVPMGAPCDLNPRPPQNWPGGLYPRVLGLAVEALRRLERDPERRYGLVLGLPSLLSEPDYVEHCLSNRDNPQAIASLWAYEGDAPRSYLCTNFGFAAGLRVDTACATGNDAVILAAQWLKAGTFDDVIVVAASALLNPISLALFHHLKALSPLADPQASCPFDRRRQGFVMGEGAAALWLTKHSQGKPLGYLLGSGQSQNASHLVELPLEPEPQLVACRAALEGLPLGLAPAEAIAYVSAHGTATQANDALETKLHKRLFAKAAPKIPLSSIKSMIGHCIGAAALIETIATLEALRDGIAPPTINLHQPDPDCDLDYVPLIARPISGKYALNQAFAFGGHNSCLLLGHGESR